MIYSKLRETGSSTLLELEIQFFQAHFLFFHGLCKGLLQAQNKFHTQLQI